MSKPATDVFVTTQQADSLTRTDALEQEITDLCALVKLALRYQPERGARKVSRRAGA